jgi:squalene-associated FAD-dependent desaturase
MRNAESKPEPGAGVRVLIPHSAFRIPHSVVVVGGGLAGLAAAVALAPRGFRVAVLESRARLGGRAGSFTDPATGALVDACQHVSMGACTNFAHFCRTVGIRHLLAPQRKLYFVTADRRTSVFKADPWPAPFHLGRALFGAHYLTPGDKLRVAWGMLALLREKPDADPPLLEWLKAHRQNDRTIERFWGVVLVSALNETVDRVGLKYARKVFVDGFLRHRDAFTVELPTVPLGRFYGDELRGWLAAHGVTLRENCAVRRLMIDDFRLMIEQPTAETVPQSAISNQQLAISNLTLRSGESLSADFYVLAVPFDRVSDLLPPDLAAHPYFAAAKNLTPSPISSVHLWFDRPVMKLPHAALVGCLGHWVFDRGEGYVQVVISAIHDSRGNDDLRQRVLEELGRLFPAVKTATLLRSKVVTEHAATFSAVPGVDRWRPAQASPIPNLAVAGDWTATGWPATMEGAVRSGYLAAEAILARVGRPERLVQPDLR